LTPPGAWNTARWRGNAAVFEAGDVRRDRFDVVDRLSMRSALMLQRAVPRSLRRGVGRYWRFLEPRIGMRER